MSGLFGKLFSYFANEVIVRNLAQSKSFQRLALKIDTFMHTKKKAITEVGETVIKTGTEAIKAKAAAAATGESSAGGVGFGKFVIAFRDEIMQDLQKVNKK